MIPNSNNFISPYQFGTTSSFYEGGQGIPTPVPMCVYMPLNIYPVQTSTHVSYTPMYSYAPYTSAYVSYPLYMSYVSPSTPMNTPPQHMPINTYLLPIPEYRHEISKGNSNNQERKQHQNGIFGSYCLEDVVAIVGLLKKKEIEKTSFSCFNKETLGDLLGIFKSTIEKNIYILDSKKINYKIHYNNKQNDLLEKKTESIWRKNNRYFKYSMVFFNPFAESKKKTEKLIGCFFDYAQNHLNKKGTVIIMWNPQRKDFLTGISIEDIAFDKSFKLITRLSGTDFAKKTEFKHFKNSTTLENAKNKNTSLKVLPYKGDTIYIFGKDETIRANNLIAKTLIEKIKPQEDL